MNHHTEPEGRTSISARRAVLQSRHPSRAGLLFHEFNMESIAKTLSPIQPDINYEEDMHLSDVKVVGKIIWKEEKV